MISEREKKGENFNTIGNKFFSGTPPSFPFIWNFNPYCSYLFLLYNLNKSLFLYNHFKWNLENHENVFFFFFLIHLFQFFTFFFFYSYKDFPIFSWCPPHAKDRNLFFVRSPYFESATSWILFKFVGNKKRNIIKIKGFEFKIPKSTESIENISYFRIGITTSSSSYSIHLRLL